MQEVYKTLYCDVAVIGGGTGGCAAAIEAARRGMHTILFERGTSLGGLATNGYVPQIAGGIEGICLEFAQRLDAIGQLLAEEDPGSVIDLLIDQQAAALRDELDERREKLEKLGALRRELRNKQIRTVESIGDIAKTMQGKKKLKKMRWTMLLTGLPVTALQWFAIIRGVVTGRWQLLAVWAVIAVPWAVLWSRYYYKNVAYLCPQCHEVFKPTFRQMFFARHTPNTRKLTCTHCGHNGFCVEVAAEQEVKGHA